MHISKKISKIIIKIFPIVFRSRFPGSRGSHPIFRSAQLLRKKSKSNLYNNINIILLYRLYIVLFNYLGALSENLCGNRGNRGTCPRMGLPGSINCAHSMEILHPRDENLATTGW